MTTGESIWRNAKDATIPDCKEEGCDRKVVTIHMETDALQERKAEYRYPGCHLVPAQAHETETIILGVDVTEVCSAGHEVRYYRRKES